MSVRSAVMQQFTQVAKEQSKPLAPLSDNDGFGQARQCALWLRARLEDELGIDPFSTAEDLQFPVTLGNFVEFYENAAK